jgi:hypothetical protein
MHTASLLPFICLLAVPDQGWLNHLMEALMLLETARSHILLGIFIGASAERADADICGFPHPNDPKMLSAYFVPRGRLADL